MCNSLHLDVALICALALSLVHSTIVVAPDDSSGAARSSFVDFRCLLSVALAELRLEDERFFETLLPLTLSFDTLLVLPNLFPLIVLLVLLASLV